VENCPAVFPKVEHMYTISVILFVGIFMKRETNNINSNAV
jgi:hypothetical protein